MNSLGQVKEKANVSRPCPLHFFGPPIFVSYLLLVTFVIVRTQNPTGVTFTLYLGLQKTLNVKETALVLVRTQAKIFLRPYLTRCVLATNPSQIILSGQPCLTYDNKLD